MQTNIIFLFVCLYCLRNFNNNERKRNALSLNYRQIIWEYMLKRKKNVLYNIYIYIYYMFYLILHCTKKRKAVENISGSFVKLFKSLWLFDLTTSNRSFALSGSDCRMARPKTRGSTIVVGAIAEDRLSLTFSSDISLPHIFLCTVISDELRRPVLIVCIYPSRMKSYVGIVNKTIIKILYTLMISSESCRNLEKVDEIINTTD